MSPHASPPREAGPRDLRGLIPLAPALLVGITALAVLPEQAGGFRLTKWSVFGLALAASALALRFRETPLRIPRGWLPLGLFVAAALVLPCFSSWRTTAHFPNGLAWLSGLALFFVTASALDDEGDDGARARRNALVVLVGSGVVCALVVLLQAAGVRWLTSDVYTGLEFRSPGTFGNPNWAAAYLAPLVPLTLGLAVRWKAARQRRWLFAATALLTVATIATVSKGGLLSLGAGLLAYGALGQDVPRRRRFALLSVGALGAVSALVVAWRLDLFTEAPWLRGRIFLYRAALVLLGEHPLTGVGLGGFNAAYGDAAAKLVDGDPNAFVPLSTIDFAHNDLLQLAAEGGLLTALAFVVLIGAALLRAHRLGDPLARAVGGALAALVVSGLFDSPLRVPSTFVLFFFVLGWLHSAPSVSSPGAATRSTRRASPAWLSMTLLAACALLGLLQGVRFAAGNAAWTRGRDALSANRPAVDDLARARFWLPEHGRSAIQYARALARAGRFEDALAAAEEAAALRFDFDDEIFRRDLQARFVDPATQIAAWRDLSARFPALVTPHLRLGALYLRQNDRAAAIAAYEAVLASPQTTPRAEAARAQARKLLQSLSSGPRRRSR